MLTPEQIKNALDEKVSQPPDGNWLDIQNALMAENDALRAENKRLREALGALGESLNYTGAAINFYPDGAAKNWTYPWAYAREALQQEGGEREP